MRHALIVALGQLPAAAGNTVPYEPPRGRPGEVDPGPPAQLARLLAGGEPGFAWPDFASLPVTAHPSFGTGPIYRGRFADLSHDD